MAAGDAYFDCTTIPVEPEVLIKSLFVKDTAGKIYLNTTAYQYLTCPVSAVTCGTWDEVWSLLQAAIEIDACGLPSLAVYTGAAVIT